MRQSVPYLTEKRQRQHSDTSFIPDNLRNSELEDYDTPTGISGQRLQTLRRGLPKGFTLPSQELAGRNKSGFSFNV